MQAVCPTASWYSVSDPHSVQPDALLNLPAGQPAAELEPSQAVPSGQGLHADLVVDVPPLVCRSEAHSLQATPACPLFDHMLSLPHAAQLAAFATLRLPAGHSCGFDVPSHENPAEQPTHSWRVFSVPALVVRLPAGQVAQIEVPVLSAYFQQWRHSNLLKVHSG